MKPCQHRNVIQDIAGQCALIPDYEFNLAHPQNPCALCEPLWIDDMPPTEAGPLHLEIIELQIKKEEMLQPRQIFIKTQKEEGNDKSPSFFEKSASYIKSQTQNIKNGLAVVSDEDYQNRLNICAGNEELSILPCEFYKDNHCRLCGCRLEGDSGFTSKLKLPHSTCPIHKWLPTI